MRGEGSWSGEGVPWEAMLGAESFALSFAPRLLPPAQDLPSLPSFPSPLAAFRRPSSPSFPLPPSSAISSRFAILAWLPSAGQASPEPAPGWSGILRSLLRIAHAGVGSSDRPGLASATAVPRRPDAEETGSRTPDSGGALALIPKLVSILGSKLIPKLAGRRPLRGFGAVPKGRSRRPDRARARSPIRHRASGTRKPPVCFDTKIDTKIGIKISIKAGGGGGGPGKAVLLRPISWAYAWSDPARMIPAFPCSLSRSR